MCISFKLTARGLRYRWCLETEVASPRNRDGVCPLDAPIPTELRDDPPLVAQDDPMRKEGRGQRLLRSSRVLRRVRVFAPPPSFSNRDATDRKDSGHGWHWPSQRRGRLGAMFQCNWRDGQRCTIKVHRRWEQRVTGCSGGIADRQTQLGWPGYSLLQ